MRGVRNRKSGQQTFQNICFAFVLIFFIAFPLQAQVDVRANAENTMGRTLEALWTDQAFSAELKRQQQALKNALEKKLLSKTDLEKMASEKILTLLKEQQTSRYKLKKMPEELNELFSPYLEWEDFRKLIWQAAASGIPQDQQLVITVGTLAPSGTPWINVPEQFIPILEEMSDNKVTIKIYTGGVMGEDTDILRKMDVGQLDGCGATALGILGASPEASVFLLPGLFNNHDEIDYIFEKFRKEIDQYFEKRGYLLASLIDTGNFYFFSKRKIASLDDIKRSKVLTWFGEIETTLFSELDISAMPVSVTEIVSALSTGMAETNLSPAAWMLGMQAYQYAKYFVKDPLLYSPAAIFVSTRTRERMQKQFGLSETFSYNTQEMLIFEFNALEEEWKHQLRRYETRCLEAFETRVGMKAVTLPAEDKKAIEEAGIRVRNKLADKLYPREFLDDILNALEEYRQGGH